jgi:hypothetical protein
MLLDEQDQRNIDGLQMNNTLMNEYSLKRNVNKISMKPSMSKPDEYWLNQKKLAR